MTKCNFCSIKSIRARAKANGEKVTTRRDPAGTFLGGTTVLVHPKSVTAREARKAVDKSGEAKYFAAWLGELPSACVC